jgi:hypothetical protein
MDGEPEISPDETEQAQRYIREARTLVEGREDTSSVLTQLHHGNPQDALTLLEGIENVRPVEILLSAAIGILDGHPDGEIVRQAEELAKHPRS